MALQYLDVAIPVGVRRTFTYTVPAQLQNAVTIGSRVVVPFARKQVTGVVVGFADEPPGGDYTIHAVESVLEGEGIPAPLVQLALWISRYYFTPPGEVLKALFPAGTQVSSSQRVAILPQVARLMSGGLRPTGLRPREETILDVLSRDGEMDAQQLAQRSGLQDASTWIAALAARNLITVESRLSRPAVAAKEQLGIRAVPLPAEIIGSLTATQQRLYKALDPGEGMIPLQRALQTARTTMSVAKTLAAKGLVEISPIQVERVPLDLADAVSRSALVLTHAQQQALLQLREMLGRQEALRCLLHGVTGSGKTEVYLRLIAEALKRGESALLLVPEIGLTPLLSRIVVSHFPDLVSLLHSGMSPGERFDQWNKIRTGSARVVVGTRSAVFAPLDGLRLIIIDEEQDASYKQDESPCYHAREVAWQRVRQSKGLLVMGSATPSMEVFHAAGEGQVACLSLRERIEARPLPEVTIVDMGLEFQQRGKRTIISETLRLGLEDCLKRGEQSLILLNRRGYARTLMCRSCGHVSLCSECSVSMTYHQAAARMICHYCGLEKQVPSTCSNCGGEYIYFTGVGTEQLEQIVRTLLPNARLARLDRDTTQRRGALRRILLDFAEHRLDVLIGTQMLAKGHDFPNVTLVGVAGADAGLSFPDFRSAERTFQLLTQVAGRAGRGSAPGRVIIQSFYPDHYALRFAQKQDYCGFYEHEIEFRRHLRYPPFAGLVQILVSDTDYQKAFASADKVATALKLFNGRLDPEARVQVLGPAVAPLEKLRGNYRMQILIKHPHGGAAVSVLREAFDYLAQKKFSHRGVHVDVDPVSLL